MRADADIFMMLVVSEGTSGNIALHMCEARSSQQRYRDQGLELCEVAIRIANASLLATRSQTEACSCRASSQPPRQRPTSHARSSSASLHVVKYPFLPSAQAFPKASCRGAAIAARAENTSTFEQKKANQGPDPV